MAIYHLSLKPVSRGGGRSATAAAAYRAAEIVHDHTSGQTFDYTPYYSKTRIGKGRRYLVGSTNAVEAANLYSAPRSEYGCWIERQAATQIEYLKAVNRLLRARLGRRRLVFTDPERRTLAVLAKEIGSKMLRDLDPLVSPVTLLRWHRELVAQKWTFLDRRTPGRPRTKVDIEQLVVRMASENLGWGYARIHGALLNHVIKIGRGTIRRILKDHLIEPAPARGRRLRWSVFLKAHWKAIAASDFFSVEVWSWRGLVTLYILFVIDLATRRVVIAGITTNPNEVWMLQMARNLTDTETGILRGTRHLIVDRDTKYSARSGHFSPARACT